jgi:hypothetical protein
MTVASKKPVRLQELRAGEYFTSPGGGEQLQLEAVFADGTIYLSNGARGWEASAESLAAMGFKAVAR